MENKVRGGVAEDRITGAIESQTSRIPSSGYLAAAFGSIAASAILKMVGKARLGTLRRPMARGVHVNGCIQQNGQAARFRCV